MGKDVNADYVRQIINLTQTTSASDPLLVLSLDISPSQPGNGRAWGFPPRCSIWRSTPGKRSTASAAITPFPLELMRDTAVADFDRTKLAVHTRGIGLAGIEVYDILRDDYGIQIEFGDLGSTLAIISVGDTELAIERLVSALAEIKRRYERSPEGMFDH